MFFQSFVQQIFLESLVCVGAGNLAVNKAEENACPYEVYILVGEVDNKQGK